MLLVVSVKKYHSKLEFSIGYFWGRDLRHPKNSAMRVVG
jgi:hypothetical protein